MKVHTNTPSTVATVHTALRRAKLAGQVEESVFFYTDTETVSRTHQSAAEVRLVVGDGGRGTEHPYRPQGIPDAWAATYDEWGWFLAAVFAIDPSAKTSVYRNREDFQTRTSGAYKLDED